MKQPQNSDSETEESEIRQILALEIARRHLFSAPCSSGEKASSHPRALSISKHDEAGSHCFRKHLSHRQKVSFMSLYVLKLKTLLPFNGFKI